MTFANKLREMEKQPKVDKQKEHFENELAEIYRSIQNGCIQNVARHRASGYIIHSYEREYGQNGYVFRESLNIDNSAHLKNASKSKTKNSRYYANIALFRHYNHSYYDGYEPISTNKAECDAYIPRLRALLVKDGFRIRELTSHAVTDEYDTIEYRGFFTPEPYLVRHTTSEIIGYVIRFSVDW